MKSLILVMAITTLLVVAILIIAIMVAVCLFEKNSKQLPSDPSKYDIIVVFGARVTAHGPSPELAARLDYALYLHRITHKPIAISGGFSGSTSEVEVMYSYLQSCGLNDNQVNTLMPGNSTVSTIMSMAKHGIHYRWLAVSSPYHSARLRYLAFKHGIYLSPCCPALAKTSHLYLARQRLREIFAILMQIAQDLRSRYIISW
jgi:vancomycin permeability regulator SanA